MDLSSPGVMHEFGGDSSAVQDQLRGVQQIQSTRNVAFAAILDRWIRRYLGWCKTVAVTVRQFEDQLKGVRQIQATGGAFAAILADGSVVTWGDAEDGGDSSAVRDQLKNVQQIQATQKAFAAILADGSVVTWGDAEDGGDSSAVQDQLRMV